MKKRLLLLSCFAAAISLLMPSCVRTLEEPSSGNLPEGTPIMMRVDFGADYFGDLAVSTKAEATPADEERIHDLYVMIFCNNPEDTEFYGKKIYGRYFSYEHLKESLSELDSDPDEGWWVENRTIDGTPEESSVSKTRGAVKISTRVCSIAKLVVIANVDNAICKLGDQADVIDYLNGIRTLEQLRGTVVKLEQDIVNRKDLFLMLGQPEDNAGNLINVNTGTMEWGTLPKNYTGTKVSLHPVDAKVKFKIRINDPDVKDEEGNPITYIRDAKAVYWEVCNTPDRCYLFSDYASGHAPDNTVYFNSEQAYFDGQDEDGWYHFSFYTLESRHSPKATAAIYHDREKQNKADSGRPGYSGPESGIYGGNFVENGEWIYAMPNATYVKFDMVLTLTPEGVQALGGSVNHALTSDTIYTVHLGDFSNSGVNDYNTFRSTFYTYEITIGNSGSIYAEVTLDQENQPGQEGYLLLTDDEIVNADCHYEYHSITFTYDPDTTPEKFSWYVKTPFTSKVGGGPTKGTKKYDSDGDGILEDYPIYDPHDLDGTLLDFRWIKFGINATDPSAGYTTHRMAYPGDDEYDKDWGVGEHGPWDGTPHPELMDISQLIQYIFEQTDKEKKTGSSDFKTDTSLGKKVIRATIFIDEFYYEVDPRDESPNPQPDLNLWRQFVNAQPREMHILSKTIQSRDRKSDVIESSHSVIQQSIQSIYNVFDPSLRSIWGCEHLDEIKYTLKEEDGVITNNPAGDWPYWPEGCSDSEKSGADNEIGRENGRLNSAYIWGLYTTKNNNGTFLLDGEGNGLRDWRHFLNYEVNNRVPELRDDTDSQDWGDGTTHKFHGMAFSCLTRNRDNNGNHKIDPEEVRWFLASSQQLAGIWVGTESLSTTARLYQPGPGQWRAHVVSSTNKLVSWAEEGGGATDISHDVSPGNPYYTWPTAAEAYKGESVRCIRNIGTYDDPVKGVTDITYAPVTLLPDKYFTVEKRNSSGGLEEDTGTYDDSGDYYVFHFNRLNTKSIREYSAGELPYHDQMSLNNRVYVKMITQNLDQDVPAFSKPLGEINNDVTKAGHNEYCPEGYRFPNHTEWLLMSLYLPETYLRKDKDGNSYPGTYVCATRTYYDRGYFGSLKSDSAPWSTESGKVGWMYSNKLHCSPYAEAVTHSRCVKDENQTGVISGKIGIEGNEIYPGDRIPVDFKFSSTASAFNDATLTLWYTDQFGFPASYDLTPQMKTPTGLQYKESQDIVMPTLTELGLTSANLPVPMTLQVEFTNLNNRSGSDEIAVQLKNPLSASLSADSFFYPNDSQGGRMTYSFSTAAHSIDLSSATFKLCYTDQNSVPREIPITGVATPSGKSAAGEKVISIPSLSDLGLNTLGFNLSRPMTIQATVTAEDGLRCTVTSDPITLVSHLAGSAIEFPTAYDETNGIPVNVIVESVNDHATISSATLYYKTAVNPGYSSTVLSGSGTSNMSLATYVKDLMGADVTEGSKYYFYLEANCNDGTSIRSDVWSMDVLWYGKCWNPGPWSEGNKASDIKNKWNVQSVTGLDFANGDFIDTYIDVSNCRYIRYNGTSNDDIGMDNLITIGTSANLTWENGNIFFYYPAHNPDEIPEADRPQDRLQVSIKDNSNTVTRLRPYDLTENFLTVKLSKDLLLVNGAELDYSDVKPGSNNAGSNSDTRSRATVTHISSQSTVKLGSVEGSHRSRATYKYVRVVRKEAPIEP